MPLLLQFTRKALNNVSDASGSWQFEGGSVAQNSEHVANYASIKRVILQGTDQDGQNTASVTTTIFFIGSHPPDSITLVGAHDFGSGNETGSVSAASNAYAAEIGKQFMRTGASNLVHIG
jgi:PKD repeat protein